MKTKGKKGAKAHPGKGLPIGHVKCDNCKRPLLLKLAVVVNGQKLHPIECAPTAIAAMVGAYKAAVANFAGLR